MTPPGARRRPPDDDVANGEKVAGVTDPADAAAMDVVVDLEHWRRAPLRAAFFAEADKVIAQDQLFIPIARPLRWSLVTPNLGGFAENARAIHPLNRLASTQN